MSILNVGNSGDGRKIQNVFVMPKRSDGGVSPARRQQVPGTNSGNQEHFGLRRLKGNEAGARPGSLQPLRQQEPQQSQTTRTLH